jgi:hypothetical protein
MLSDCGIVDARKKVECHRKMAAMNPGMRVIDPVLQSEPFVIIGFNCTYIPQLLRFDRTWHKLFS